MLSRRTLPGGARLLYRKTSSDIAVVNVSVLAGSVHEPAHLYGISHFVEHMLFEGTSTRSAEQITSEIERYGGEINAYTSTEKTNYYVKIHRRHAGKAFEILSDMLFNSSFAPATITKEKGVVLKEIDMVNDEPRHFQWIAFEKALLPEPFGHPVYGTKEAVSRLTREDILDYHGLRYTPRNIIITVVGNCPKVYDMAKRYFSKGSDAALSLYPTFSLATPPVSRAVARTGLSHRYLTLGRRTPPLNHKDVPALEIIQAFLARGQSGRLFVEIRVKRGLAYELGINHQANPHYGYFAFYVNADRANIPVIERIFHDELRSVADMTSAQLAEVKSYIEGNLALTLEDSQEHADTISLFEEGGNYRAFHSYISGIKRVTRSDIRRVLNTYLKGTFTRVTLG